MLTLFCAQGQNLNNQRANILSTINREREREREREKGSLRNHHETSTLVKYRLVGWHLSGCRSTLDRLVDRSRLRRVPSQEPGTYGGRDLRLTPRPKMGIGGGGGSSSWMADRASIMAWVSSAVGEVRLAACPGAVACLVEVWRWSWSCLLQLEFNFVRKR